MFVCIYTCTSIYIYIYIYMQCRTDYFSSCTDFEFCWASTKNRCHMGLIQEQLAASDLRTL